MVKNYAELLDALECLHEQCAAAKDKHAKARQGSAELLWLGAANAISAAIGECKEAQDSFIRLATKLESE